MPDPQTYVYGQRENIKGRESSHTSVVGSGRAKADAGRQAVIDKVKQNLLNRMQAANDGSAASARAIQEKVAGYKEKYENSFEDIANLKKQLNVIPEVKRSLETKKADMEKEDSAYMTAKNKLSQKQEKVQKREKHLQRRKEKMESRESLLSSVDKKDDASSRRRLEIINDLVKYDQKHDLSEEKFDRRTQQLAQAREEEARASAEFSPLQSRYNEVNRLLDAVNAQENELNTELQKHSGELLNQSVADEAKLNQIYAEARNAYKAYYDAYDDAVMKYYVLAREQAPVGQQGAVQAIENAKPKDIQEYVGVIRNLPDQAAMAISQILLEPGTRREIKIESASDKKAKEGSLNEVTEADHMKHHRGIRAERDNGGQAEKVKLDSKFNQKGFQPAGNVPASGDAPAGTPLQPREELALTVDRKDAHGFYMLAADTVGIETINTKKRKNVSGIMLNGEFISEDDKLYSSKSDASFFSRKAVSDSRRAMELELEQDIRDSGFFRHIYSEMIEYYMTYPGDAYDRALWGRNASQNPGAAPGSGNSVDMKTAGIGELLPELYQRVRAAGGATAGGVTIQSALETAKSEIDREAFWNKEVFPQFVRFVIASGDNAVLGKLNEITAISSSDDLKNAANAGDYARVCEICDKLESTESGFWKGFEKTIGFLGGDGVSIDEGSKGAVFNGLINYGEMQNAYETGNSLWALLTGKKAQLAKLENDISNAGNAADKAKLEKDKEALEEEIDHGALADSLSLINSVIGIVGNTYELCKLVKETIKNDDGDDGPESRYSIPVLELVIEFVEKIFGLTKSVFEAVNSIAGLAGKVLAKADPAEKAFNIIEGSFNAAKAIYSLVQNSFKYHNISKAENTIMSAPDNSDLKKASNSNMQVMQFLGSARRNTGKAIAEDSQTIVTSGIDVASEAMADPVTSTILSLSSTFINWFGKLITNGIYKRREKTAAFIAAFGEEKGTRYRDYPGTDKALRRMVGIKSADHLAKVTRIMAAIDTHVLIRAAPANSPEWTLAKTAMSAFYKPDEAKLRKVPFSDLLEHVGSGGDWRSELASALA